MKGAKAMTSTIRRTDVPTALMRHLQSRQTLWVPLSSGLAGAADPHTPKLPVLAFSDTTDNKVKIYTSGPIADIDNLSIESKPVFTTHRVSLDPIHAMMHAQDIIRAVGEINS